MSHPSRERRTAFLNFFLGGSGREAGKIVGQLYRADERPFPMLAVCLDTDPQAAPFADRSIFIPLDGDKVNVLRSNPATFGEAVEIIVRYYPQFLDPEDVMNGSRTIRLLTQLSWAFYRDHVLHGVRQALFDLAHQGDFDSIIPVLVSSSGGGAGSALQILLPQALKNPSFAARLTEGLPPGYLQTPISFVADPHAMALLHTSVHADRILANAYAFRVESEILSQQLNAYKYIYHLGLANEYGTVLDSPEEIGKVLGTSVYQVERSWNELKARKVDTADISSILSRYTGTDVVENVGQNAVVSLDLNPHRPPNGKPATKPVLVD